MKPTAKQKKNKRTPALEELRIMIDAAVFWQDAEADEEHPDPISDAHDLIQDAQATLKLVEKEHAALVAALKLAKKHLLDASKGFEALGHLDHAETAYDRARQFDAIIAKGAK